MSLILDALNRSRTESDPVPGLASQPIYLEDTPSPLRRWFPWAALCVALVLVAWLVWERLGEPAGEQRVQAGGAPVDTSVAQPATTAPAGSVSASAAGEKADAGARVVAPTPTAQANAKAVPKPVNGLPSKSPAPQQTAETRAANPAVAQLYKNPPPAKPKPAVKQKPAVKPKAAVTADAASPPDVDKLVAMAEQARKEAALEDHPAPFVTALSQSQKDAIPTLLYERHDYNSDRGRSAVVINGRSVRAGGVVGSGVRVEEILSDSVVLKHGDTVFRLRALNSWVNL